MKYFDIDKIDRNTLIGVGENVRKNHEKEVYKKVDDALLDCIQQALKHYLKSDNLPENYINDCKIEEVNGKGLVGYYKDNEICCIQLIRLDEREIYGTKTFVKCYCDFA